MATSVEKRFANYMVSCCPVYSSLEQVRHFDFVAELNDPQRQHMSLELMWKADVVRDIAGVPMIIHSAYAISGHSNPNSTHYRGLALDWHLKYHTLEEMFRLAYLVGFTGIGVYPEWNNPGLHTDVRQLLPGQSIATWEAHYKWIGEEGRRKKVQVYEALSDKYRRLMG